jgi:ornithine decarboxylase
MISKAQLQRLGREHGTPLFVVDHDALRSNYREFKRHLPRVQAYFAVKANPLPEIVRTFFLEGASFDVASMPEFNIVYDNIKGMAPKERQDWIWDKIIYANPNKPVETLEELNQYKPLVTFDNAEELLKISRARAAGRRGAAPQGHEHRGHGGALLEVRGRPGEAVDLILLAQKARADLRGPELPRRQPDDQLRELRPGARPVLEHLQGGPRPRLPKMNLVDIGGGFPARYDESVKPFRELASGHQQRARRLFPKDIQILAEPGRFLVANAGYAVSKVIGKACATASRATTSTTASTTPTPGSSSTTASTP